MLRISAIGRSLVSALAVFFSLAAVAPARTALAIEWVPVGPPGNPAIRAMAVGKSDYVLLARRPSLLFAATVGAGVFRSDDDGGSWTSTGSGLGSNPVALAVRQVFHLGVDTGSYDTTVFAGTSGGIYRLTPGATAWVLSNVGLTSLDVRALAVSGDGVVDRGKSIAVFAGTAGGLFASADGGDSWVPKTAGLPSGADAAITALASDPSAPSTLYAGTHVGLFKSTDGGETWSNLDTSSTFKLAVAAIAVDPLTPSRVYAAGIANPQCFPLCLAPSFPISLRSLDGGTTWATIDGLDGRLVSAFAATPNLPAIVFAATTGDGVFQSVDGGGTWAAVNNGLPIPSVSSLVIDPVLPSFLFAGTGQGVFCAPLGQLAVTCSSGGSTLCLSSQRFGVTVVWRDPRNNVGSGQGIPVTDNAGAFWFFSANNVEVAVKVVDGRAFNGKFWVFYGALSNVEYTITVTDTLTGDVKTYFNPEGQLSSVADTSAF
jgi:photosystem II stability/assembly factor-like uncharacterized protein